MPGHRPTLGPNPRHFIATASRGLSGPDPSPQELHRPVRVGTSVPAAPPSAQTPRHFIATASRGLSGPDPSPAPDPKNSIAPSAWEPRCLDTAPPSAQTPRHFIATASRGPFGPDPQKLAFQTRNTDRAVNPPGDPPRTIHPDAPAGQTGTQNPDMVRGGGAASEKRVGIAHSEPKLSRRFHVSIASWRACQKSPIS